MSPRLRLCLILFAVVLTPVVMWVGLHAAGAVPAPGAVPERGFKLSDRLAALDLIDTPDGPRVRLADGSEMAPEAFLRNVASAQAERHPSGRGWLFAVLDITSVTGLFWVAIGLLGQVLFTARMLVQWFASERAKRSVVPVSFWWLSLLGASMLLVYFIWRVDIVGVIGQGTGWAIYLRNLWLIHQPANDSTDEPATA